MRARMIQPTRSAAANWATPTREPHRGTPDPAGQPPATVPAIREQIRDRVGQLRADLLRDGQEAPPRMRIVGGH
jgi:hypothetical protein